METGLSKMPRPRTYALSETQARLLLAAEHRQRVPAHDVAHLVEGPLDPWRIRKAMRRLLAAHPALRSGVVRAPSAAQVVMPQAEPVLLEMNAPHKFNALRDVRSTVRAAFGSELVRVGHVPMWYVCLIRHSPTLHTVYVAASTLVLDYRSVGLLLQGLVSAYLDDAGVPQVAEASLQTALPARQAAWRAAHADDWLAAWCERVDFTRHVSDRGSFGQPAAASGPPMTQIFAIDPEQLAAALRQADAAGATLFDVLLAGLSLVQCDADLPHGRICVTLCGRGEGEERELGQFQHQGLLAFELSADDDLATATRRLLGARRFLEERLGLGLEGLMEAWAAREGKAAPVPYHTYAQFLLATPMFDTPGPLPLRVSRVGNHLDATVPLDPHSEGTLKFVHDGTSCAVLVSWWPEGRSAGFYAGLWRSLGERLLDSLARVVNQPSEERSEQPDGGL